MGWPWESFSPLPLALVSSLAWWARYDEAQSRSVASPGEEQPKMNFVGVPDWLGKPFAVFLIDLLLAGDNALVIALVCRMLPPERRRMVLLFGAAGAIVLRVLLAGLAGTMLALPGLKLIGGLLLALLALNLVLPDHREASVSPLGEQSDVVAAAVLVMLFDLLMSLDNVLALAAVAGDSLLYLGLGLLLSISIVMFGSAIVARLLDRFPHLERLGATLLGWVAGRMVVSDALIQGWIATQAPALTVLAPALAAAYVYILGQNAPPHAPAIKIIKESPLARQQPRPRPSRPALEPVTAIESADSKRSERLAVIALMALFAVAGVFLGVVAYFGGGLAR
jgi:YjbE family integral membrane protein